MGKQVKSNNYFTQETEDAIVLYNASSDPVYRNRIFTDRIYYPLYKLAENIIHTFKFYYTDVNIIEDLKLEVVSMIVEEKLHRFNPELGAKAYSYFGTIIKRWLINYNSRNYKKLTQAGALEEVLDAYEIEEELLAPQEILLTQVVDRFVEHSYTNMDRLFVKEVEKKVADAILTLFRSRLDLEIFKKKALYIYIREITDCETPTLTKVITKLKGEYSKISLEYLNKGYTIR